ncbi:hypothetical protein BABINDRAFT_130764 [Babjeviella inositovora NRRL Y-12698]|uniref:Uncharacterized protein n=1 Tax=Babjeviella inositovora NRRL Y-12698 TaxID=984486 RepID=A0A1E3QRA4_9ASCO|nr:uncharacterized protein BABINDRAFT_130764 [Babjeviella inositovora NRRL Y-12698]ODQ80233.1 hypothetical protein BABINDRAFT_130764 [Babjeviella inositovora NRRL Y-12698]
MLVPLPDDTYIYYFQATTGIINAIVHEALWPLFFFLLFVIPVTKIINKIRDYLFVKPVPERVEVTGSCKCQKKSQTDSTRLSNDDLEVTVIIKNSYWKNQLPIKRHMIPLIYS